MKLVSTLDVGEVARVFLLDTGSDLGMVECVGAVDPALSREEKIVLVVSTQAGCPIGCLMCDAGTSYRGNLSESEIMGQIEFLLDEWAWPDAAWCRKLKVQFARMGEPALNPSVLEVLALLPGRRVLPGLMPCIATTAPRCAARWFEGLRAVKDRHYGGGRFQLQFSIQSTSEEERRRLIPADVWSMEEIAAFSRLFVREGDRKVTLNFAVVNGLELDPRVLRKVFDPSLCLVKLTPLNRTDRADSAGLVSGFSHHDAGLGAGETAARMRDAGFDVVVSTGLPVESDMSSSCGQLALAGAAGREG
jgi:23S rRNA (adenine2503-C2)-methyltransferase